MRRRCGQVLAAALAGTIAASAATAQHGTFDLALFARNPRKAVQEYLLVYGATLGVTDTADVGLVGDIDTTGSEREIFVTQQFRGIPVQYAAIHLHVEKATGEVTWASSSWPAIPPSTSIVPSIAADSAVAAVWRDVSCPRDEGEVSPDRLVFDFRAGASAARLAWTVYYLRRSIEGVPIEGRVYHVDAHTGAILGYGPTVMNGPSAVVGNREDGSAVALDIRPNPFNSMLTIRYDVSGAAHVRLAVYDVLGREVTVLVSEGRESGRYAVTWDGRDAAGRSVASGAYVVRLEAGATTTVRRVTMVR